jgi:NAD+ kinase
LRFGIRGNINKEQLPEVIFSLLNELDKKNISYVIEKQIAELTTAKYKYNLPAEIILKDKDLADNCDFMLSVGGDGTFLSTAKLVGDKNIPIIGVNLGKLGFLAETSTSQIAEFINDILKNKFNIEERTVLQASAESNGVNKVLFGLNEIVVNQSGSVKTIEIEAFYNDQPIINYLADGLIISTPTGSTGYSLSAGGPIVSPRSDVIVLVPICPHTLTARPIILPDSGVIKIDVISKVPVIVTADGNSNVRLGSPAVIEIKKAPYKIKIAKRLDSNYFDVLNKKLLWGEDIRKNKK